MLRTYCELCRPASMHSRTQSRTRQEGSEACETVEIVEKPFKLVQIGNLSEVRMDADQCCKQDIGGDGETPMRVVG